MNFKKKFLTLSITHQISIVIFSISVLCLLCILGLFYLYTNIILSIQSRRRKQYYYNKYKEIILSEIQFQTFLLYQYEQLIKGFNNQIYYYDHSKNDLYDTMISYKNGLIKNYKETKEEDYNPNLSDYNTTYYLLSFSNDAYIDSNIYYSLSSVHSSIDNQLKVLRDFRVPYFGNNFRIINEYIFVHFAEKSLYSVNRTRIQEIIEISGGNISDFYKELIHNNFRKYKNYMDAYINGELYFIDIFYRNIFYLFSNYNYKYNNNSKEYLNNISYYFNIIDYETGKTFISDNGDKHRVNFIGQNSITSDYINIIFSKIQNSSNINVIPVFPQNNTIMSVELCYAFLYKQMIIFNLTSKDNIFNEEKLDEIYNNLKKGESSIGDCILDKKYNIKTNQNSYKILNIKFNKYYSITNVRELSLFKLSDSLMGKNFISIKYTFPDFNSILNFKPNFLTLDQLNLYCFKSFYLPIHDFNNMTFFLNNCQYFMLLFLLYLWILIISYFFFRLKKLFREIVDPINNLNEVIRHLDVKGQNILKYEADDSINELFKLCNDLLLGKYKQKMIHEYDIEKNLEQIENNKNNNDFSNLKINRKLIEEMIENKNELNINSDEIKIFNVNEDINDKKIINKHNIRGNLRKTTIIARKFLNPSKNKDQINNIQYRVKKTNSIAHTLDMLNKKMSLDVNIINNIDNNISLYNQNEDFLEIEILVNYKHLYDIVDLTFNYELKYDNKFISKNSKLLYKSNIYNYIKYHKSKSISKLSQQKDKKQESNKKEIKGNTKIRIEDFDKSVITTYETKDMLFLWYKEAKFYHGVEFLQNNHNKELNNLCNLNIINENKRLSNTRTINNNINITSSKSKKIQMLRKTLKK